MPGVSAMSRRYDVNIDLPVMVHNALSAEPKYQFSGCYEVFKVQDVDVIN